MPATPLDESFLLEFGNAKNQEGFELELGSKGRAITLKVRYHLALHTTRQLGLALMLIRVCTKTRAYSQASS